MKPKLGMRSFRSSWLVKKTALVTRSSFSGATREYALLSLADLGVLFSGAVPKAGPRLIWTLVQEMSDLFPAVGLDLCQQSGLRKPALLCVINARSLGA